MRWTETEEIVKYTVWNEHGAGAKLQSHPLRMLYQTGRLAQCYSFSVLWSKLFTEQALINLIQKFLNFIMMYISCENERMETARIKWNITGTHNILKAFGQVDRYVLMSLLMKQKFQKWVILIHFDWFSKCNGVFYMGWCFMPLSTCMQGFNR